MDANKGHGHRHEEVQAAARALQSIRTGIVLTGRVVDGKVELDRGSMEAVASAFPRGEVAFVAVNAPFDPVAQAV